MPEDDVATINRLLELAPAKLLEVGGYTYIDKDRRTQLFEPPIGEAILVSTLTGFVELLDASVDSFDPSAVLVLVEEHDLVQMKSRHSDPWGRRRVYASARLPPQEPAFPFNRFIPQENFNIMLSSLFVPDGPLAELLKISGTLAQQSEVKQEDDGITQRVTARNGVHLVHEKTVVPRVKLSPYRTFREVAQPQGEFIFRVKNDPMQGNLCALFEADGGYWKLAAVESIQGWLSNQLKGSQVDGLPDIPVIA